MIPLPPPVATAMRYLRRGMTPVSLGAIALGLLGLLAVYNATYHLPVSHHYALRQTAWLALGTLAVLLLAGLPRSLVRRFGPILAVPAYLLLVGVLFYGIRVRQMQGWYQLPGMLLQPSELAKPFFALSLAWIYGRTTRLRSNRWLATTAVLLLGALWILPICLQPDFGMVLVYALGLLAALMVAGCPWPLLAAGIFCALPGAAWTVWRTPYVRMRFASFLDPAAYTDSAGWHILQFRRTLASGGLFGRSWGDCIWARTHLPLSYSDSMFATIGEAMGFVGVVPIILLLLAWIAYAFRRARMLPDPFSAIAATTLVTLVAGQAFLHLSVNLGLMPVTGLTLPLFSYGGSSMLGTMLCIGASESLLQKRGD